MSLAQFQPTYIFENELSAFDLPTPDAFSGIMNLVAMASSAIDIECGRIDGDGNGSLVYTQYTQRLLLQTRNRNLIYLPLKPIIGLDQTKVDELTAAASGAIDTQPYYTGFTANSFTHSGTLSGIVGASGRYGYTRQDTAVGYPDLFAFINPLNLLTMFGGPAPWVSIDVANTDYDMKTGEVWIPAGLQLQRYSEVLIVYNSGYDPRAMPRAIKFVTASLVKNAMAKGDATTAMLSMSMSKSGTNATFAKELIDPTLDRMLTPFKAVRGY